MADCNIFRSACLASLMLAVVPAAASALPLCAREPAARPAPQAVVEVDKVWSGARVDFAGTRDGAKYVVGYYDQERWLTVGWIDAATNAVRRQTLPTRFAGWDSHNAVALALDNGGRLHVAANMHASALTYFRNATAGEPLARSNMTARDDEFVTYPQFLRTAADDLLFIYRAGRSGDGVWKVNRWDGKSWSALNGGRPFFSDRGFGRNVSAYPSRFMVARDGAIHLAIVWRLTPDASTNVRLSYAKTKDFVHWFDSQDRALALPLSPEGSETVLHTGPNAGLLNNAKVSLDPHGRPVIVFTRQDAAGRNTVERAIPDHGRWRTSLLDTADHGIDVKGTGSLPNTVALSEVDFSQADRPSLYHRFPPAAGMHEDLDPATLAPVCTQKQEPDVLGKLADRPLPTARPQMLRVDADAVLIWSAQPANQDQPRNCTPDAPLACRPPPSTLKLVVTPERPSGQ